MKYKPHEERVIEELAELRTKIEALETFNKGDIYKTLPQVEQDMLLMQRNAMIVYANILGSRISRFPGCTE